MLSIEPFFLIVCKKVEYSSETLAARLPPGRTGAARSLNARVAIWRVVFTAISPRFVNNGPAKSYASAQRVIGGHASTYAMALPSPRADGHAVHNRPNVMRP